MEDYERVSEVIVDTLRLEYSPVAVKFLSKTDQIPPLARRPERPLSGFCAGVEEAAKGQNLHLQRKDVACAFAQLILGFVQELPGINSEEKFPVKEIDSVVLSPISDFQGDAGAVLVHFDPEQAERFLEALTFEKTRDEKGRKTVPSYPQCGAAFHCPAHLSVKVMAEQNMYMAFGRSRANTLSDKLILGMPYSIFKRVSENLIESEKQFKPLVREKKYHSPEPVVE